MNRSNFSKIKPKKRGTQQLFREFSRTNSPASPGCALAAFAASTMGPPLLPGPQFLPHPQPSQWRRAPICTHDPSGVLPTELTPYCRSCHHSSRGLSMLGATVPRLHSHCSSGRPSTHTCNPENIAHLSPLPRGTWAHPHRLKQRRHSPASTVAPTVAPPPCRADWISKRKADMPLKRRTAALRE